MEGIKIRNAILLIVAAFISGLVVSASMGVGPLAYISYQVQGGSSTTTTSAYTTPVYLDLGNLTAGSSGTVNGTAQLSISSSGIYEFEIKNDDHLKAVFSSFRVNVEIVNVTSFTLDLYSGKSYKVSLSPGSYTVKLTVEYTVKQNPASSTVNNMLFLKVEKSDS